MNLLDNEELAAEYMPHTIRYLKKDLDRLGGPPAYQALLQALHGFFGTGGEEIDIDATSVLMFYNIIFKVRAVKRDPEDWSPGNPNPEGRTS